MAGELGHGGELLVIARLDEGVDHVAADDHVADLRFTVTAEPMAPRLAWRFWMNSVLIARVVHAAAEVDVARAGRGHQDDVVRLAADEEVADLGADVGVGGREC